MVVICGRRSQLEGIRDWNCNDLAKWDYLRKILKLGFSTINNEAKYEPLLAGLVAMQKL